MALETLKLIKLPERIRAKIRVLPSGCWVWTGSRIPKGYGHVWLDGRTVYAHRFVYETLMGPIPEGKEIDHRCRTRSCVNPDHLEVVTRSENLRRGDGPNLAGLRQKAKTHCPKGHPYDEMNTYIFPDGRRACRVCRREAIRRWRRGKRNG